MPEVPGRFALGSGRGFSRGETEVSAGSIAVGSWRFFGSKMKFITILSVFKLFLKTGRDISNLTFRYQLER